ncbi:MAG: GNAT family N-acetyltransferase [Anaerolineae bacterium]|nr:GNAT family N-acetyltransferase [Anaerolineae bacterium]
MNRPYQSIRDLQAMSDLLAAVRPPAWLTEYPSLVDLQELFGQEGTASRTRLWESPEQGLIGFALVDAYNNLLFEVVDHPGREAVVTEMAAWGCEVVRQAGASQDEPVTLDASCREDDGERLALLKRQGFLPVEGKTVVMVRALTGPAPAPRVPEGFAIRPLRGEAEVPALVALHHAAHSEAQLTVEERLSWMRVSEYDPALDLVVVSPDGELVAYCMASLSEEENARTGRAVGYTDPVATHPDFRRLGLARALLDHSARLLQARGMDFVELWTKDSNISMQRAAASAGYRIAHVKLWFAKPVSDLPEA